MSRLITVVCIIVSLGSCTMQTGTACTSEYGSPVAIFMLYMGKAIPGRADLTNNEWKSFLEATITANLPDGYTVFDANGGWMNPATHRTVKEATKVLLVALPETPESLAAINRIRTAYQIRFQQQLVGMTVEHACSEF